MNTELRERLALKIASIRTRIDWPSWTSTCLLPSGLRDECLSDAAAILTELGAAGWCVVPEVPTEKMVEEANGIEIQPYRGPMKADYLRGDDAPEIWQAMLRARPKI